MARHTKIYDGLLSFYKASIDDIEKSIMISFEKKNLTHLGELKNSLSSELEAIVDLSRDQAVHFHRIGIIKQWEEKYLVEDTASYAMKSVKRMRSKKAISTYKKVDIARIMNDAEVIN